jgi:dsDNA-specific endonuclease/ATPase MutS2
MSDFWIGDWIRIKSTGKIGKFEGEVNGQAKIKTVKKNILIPLNDIEILPDDQIPREIYATRNVNASKDNTKASIANVIDLHIDKLASEMKNEIPELIISYQINRAKRFLTYSINQKLISVTIIHGKGVGALKMEIQNLLKSFPEVYFTKEINDGGAVEIIFQYR